MSIVAVFKYTGRTKRGEAKKGTIQANNRNAALTKLREQGINAREVVESKSILHKEIDFLTPKVKTVDFVIYCRQFATLIQAGVSIVESTNILSRQSASKPLRKALVAVEEDIRAGLRISDAAAKYPKAFPPLFVNMMRSGEATGNIDMTLERLALTYEKSYRTKKKVQSALTYPAVLLVITIGVALFMMLSIVPNFVSTYESMGAELPWITLVTMKLSDWFINYWWLSILLFAATIGTIVFLYKTNKIFHYTVSLIILRIPAFGPLFQKNEIAVMTRTLSSLFSSAVPILQSLRITERIVGNPVVGKVILEACANLEKGGTLSEPFAKSWLFPPLVTSMTQIGESTGSLDFMLEKVADFYEDEVDRAVDTLKSLIEPAMILLLAGVVGFIGSAVLLPMFKLYEQM